MTTTRTPIGTRERVGSYETLDGAALAVSHLVELEYDPGDVAIAPRDFDVVETSRLRDRVRGSAIRGAVAAGAVIGAAGVVATIGFGELVRFVLPLALVATLVGAGAGIVAALVGHRRASLFVDPNQARGLTPTRFDVVVDRWAGGARHELARWWDPAARPRERDRASGVELLSSDAA
jgi:hypothetical protein